MVMSTPILPIFGNTVIYKLAQNNPQNPQFTDLLLLFTIFDSFLPTFMVLTAFLPTFTAKNIIFTAVKATKIFAFSTIKFGETVEVFNQVITFHVRFQSAFLVNENAQECGSYS
jgi:hypothetical protein